jgi:hypothetical protein
MARMVIFLGNGNVRVSPAWIQDTGSAVPSV